MPELEEIATGYKGEIGVLGICADIIDRGGKVNDGLLNTAKEIVNELGITYISAVPSAKMWEGMLYDLVAYPRTYIVDEDGKVLESFYGSKTKEQFLKLVEKYQ